MKLWLLKRHARQMEAEYDCVYSFVIRALNEDDARERASENCGDEGMNVWLDHTRTSCEELTVDGYAGIVLRDFNAG